MNKDKKRFAAIGGSFIGAALLVVGGVFFFSKDSSDGSKGSGSGLSNNSETNAPKKDETNIILPDENKGKQMGLDQDAPDSGTPLPDENEEKPNGSAQDSPEPPKEKLQTQQNNQLGATAQGANQTALTNGLPKGQDSTGKQNGLDQGAPKPNTPKPDENNGKQKGSDQDPPKSQDLVSAFTTKKAELIDSTVSAFLKDPKTENPLLHARFEELLKVLNQLRQSNPSYVDSTEPKFFTSKHASAISEKAFFRYIFDSKFDQINQTLQDTCLKDAEAFKVSFGYWKEWDVLINSTKANNPNDMNWLQFATIDKAEQHCAKKRAEASALKNFNDLLINLKGTGMLAADFAVPKTIAEYNFEFYESLLSKLPKSKPSIINTVDQAFIDAGHNAYKQKLASKTLVSNFVSSIEQECGISNLLTPELTSQINGMNTFQDAFRFVNSLFNKLYNLTNSKDKLLALAANAAFECILEIFSAKGEDQVVDQLLIQLKAASNEYEKVQAWFNALVNAKDTKNFIVEKNIIVHRSQLRMLHKERGNQFAAIPLSRRVIVTSQIPIQLLTKHREYVLGRG